MSKETNQVICLTAEEGVTWGKIYDTLIPTENDDVAVIIDENDERHELSPNEYDSYYGVDHLKEIMLEQLNTDLAEKNLNYIIKYIYTGRVSTPTRTEPTTPNYNLKNWAARYYKDEKVVSVKLFRDRTEQNAEDEANLFYDNSSPHDDWTLTEIANNEPIDRDCGLSEVDDEICCDCLYYRACPIWLQLSKRK